MRERSTLSHVSFWLMPDIGVVFSSTFVFGPKALNSRAQANGLGICVAPEIACGLKGRDTRNQDKSGRNLLDDNCLHDNLVAMHKGAIVALEATSDFLGRTNSQAAGLGCSIVALQAKTQTF